MINDSLYEGAHIRLTAYREDDAAKMIPWFQDPAFTRNLNAGAAFPKTEKQIADMRQEAVASANDYEFMIRHRETDALLGFIGLDGILWNNGCCAMFLGIGDADCRGKGYGSEAITLLLRFAFEELNLHRVALSFFAYNERGRRVYEKLGFVHEGVQRDFIRRDGHYYDMILMSMLRDEWAARYKGDA